MAGEDGLRAVERAAPAPPARAAGDPTVLEAGLGFRLGRLTRTLRADWARELDDLGLTPPQAALLRGLAGRPGCSLRSLARLLGTEPMRAKRCVDDLEGRGLLESAHRGADRRPRSLELTAQGLALARRVDALARRQDARLGEVLGSVRRARLEEAVAVLEVGLGLVSPGIAPKGGTSTTRERP